MDKNLSVLVSLSCVIVTLALFGIKEATAICTPDILEDWPDAPCGLPLSTEKLRQDWQGYYEFKGKEWMEGKRAEMEKAILSGTLEQWRSDGANHNVWLYYKITNNIPEVPPIKQFKFGIPLTEIKCKENLTLLKKTSNGLPICVSIKTGQKLLERKFAQTMAVTGSLESLQKSDSKGSESTITINSVAGCSNMRLEQLPVDEWHERMNDRYPPIVFTAKDIEQSGLLRKMFETLNDTSNWGTYDKNSRTLFKEFETVESEQIALWEWLHDKWDSQHGQEPDRAFSPMLTYDNKYYEIVFGPVC